MAYTGCQVIGQVTKKKNKKKKQKKKQQENYFAYIYMYSTGGAKH